MNFQTKNRVSVFLITTVIIMLSCMLLEEESKRTIMHEYYAIEPDSMLQSLSQGTKDVFSLTTNETDYSASPPGPTVNWKQSDYFYIIEAFYTDVLGDTLEDWNLNSMGFFMTCDEIQNGFQDGRFEFFKVVKGKNEREARITRFIDIDARYKLVTIRETEYVPKLMNWSSIDLANTRITAEDALQIAEKNGGMEKRISVPNSCSISVSIAPDSVVFEGWLVSYSLEASPTSFFSVEIDPFTGAYK